MASVTRKPMILDSIHQNTADGPVLENFNVDGTAFRWVPDIQPNTQVAYSLSDNTGAISKSAPVPVNAGDTACIGQNPNASAGASSAASPSGASSTTSTPSTSATRPASSAASSSAAGNAAMPTNVANMGMAGVLGAALAVVLA
ncbi:hypothetical protein HGRIS_004013 [Hohenbuehelia grisea]|uniref:Uncharacterized protein n=1 Tax=Hohenbuehelia grisea TaxID=104357 RepID=A0ABR3JHA0_9AGAR